VSSGLSQVEYFWKCLQLWKIGNVDGRLANAGIVTSNTPILISNFERQLAKQMEGIVPILTCEARTGNKRELKEIRFCFNMTNNFVPCGVKDNTCRPKATAKELYWST
jgi:hypothetical protein